MTRRFDNADELDTFIRQANAIADARGGRLPVVVYVDATDALYEVAGVEFNDDDGELIAMITVVPPEEPS